MGGKLKIFFGYAAGTGKTHAMLLAAKEAAELGTDVVIGYLEPGQSPQNTALAESLEKLPTAEGYSQQPNIDGAINRKPQLIVIDGLAHTNLSGSRHAKRYQDIEELLAAGIDVYTTLDVQHIESLNDLASSVIGQEVGERIPDKIFDHADYVEFTDIEPEELLSRSNSLPKESLAALREIALRRCAERINKLSGVDSGEFHTGEHILVCLSSSPSNSRIIRTAARMAKAFKGTLTALFVETPDFASASEENKARLRENMRIASQLGANIETVMGEDIAYQISEFARLSRVTKAVLGRSSSKRRFFFGKPALAEKIIGYSPDLDIYIIPDSGSADKRRFRLFKGETAGKIKASDIIKTIAVTAAATAVGFLFERFGINEANIITVYILGVLLIAVSTSYRLYSIVSSLASVFLFNFFFTEPKFTFNFYDSAYAITFLVMFIAALITSNLAARIKHSAKLSALTAYRTKILFDTNKLLQQADEEKDIAMVTANQLTKLLDRDIVFYHSCEDKLAEPQIFSAGVGNISDVCLSPEEKAVAEWTFRNNKRAGAATDTFSGAAYQYLAVRVNDSVYGVVGISLKEDTLDPFENSIVLSILGECALAMENLRNIAEKENAAVLAKNEQLRANLLRSISHDLRTPLTAISGNADILISSSDNMDHERRLSLYNDIHEDSLWLISLVENLLSVTRIEDGTMKIRQSSELIEEVINEALDHLGSKKGGRKITVTQPDEFLIAKIDARLIVQVIINILDNAMKYTPEGSEININVSRSGEWIRIDIADNGPGISDQCKPKIFDMFYTAETKIADSRRSMGLGLALCKSIITAHGGSIEVGDNEPTGAVFSFTLPAEEVNLHE